MANDKKKMVEAITAQEVDFAQWYTDICKKAELVDYSSVKGCVILRPYGYAIWENIQKTAGRAASRPPATRTWPCRMLDPREPAAEGEGPRGGLCPGGGLGDHGRQRAAGGAPVRAPHFARRCSATILPMCCTPGATCPCCTTSGAAWSAGKRPPVPSCAAVSSGGRRATPSTRPPKRPRPRPSSS